MEKTTGMIMAEALREKGVRHVIGMPASHCLHGYDALYGQSDITVYQVTDETNASIIAEGYGRVARKPMVCLVTAGPGGTRLLSGVVEALQEPAPMIAITTDVAAAIRGKGCSHDMDIETPYKGQVKAAFRVTAPEKMRAAVHEAYDISVTGKPGPVQILVGADIWSKTTDKPAGAGGRHIRPLPPPRDADIARALDILTTARRPIIYAGAGVHTSSAMEELRNLAEALQAPVFTSLPGRGVLPETHPLSAGLLTFRGIESIRDEADACLAVGTAFAETSTLGWSIKLPNNLVHIDVDPQVIGRNYPVAVGIVADARQALLSLLAAAPRRQAAPETLRTLEMARAAWRDEISKFMSTQPSRPIHPRWLTQQLRRAFPEETIFTIDGTQTQFWFYEEAFPFTQPRTLLPSTVFQSMGCSFNMAIGAKLAAPDRPVVAACGDGSFLMQIGEIPSAVHNGVAPVAVIYNNGWLNAIRHFQRLHMNGRTIGVRLPPTDYAALARVFGAEGYRVEQPEQLGPALEAARRATRLTVIDVVVDDMPLPHRWTMRASKGVAVTVKDQRTAKAIPA